MTPEPESCSPGECRLLEQIRAKQMIKWLMILALILVSIGSAAIGSWGSYVVWQKNTSDQLAEARAAVDTARQVQVAAEARARKALQAADEVAESMRRSLPMIALGRHWTISLQGWLVHDGKPHRRITEGTATHAVFGPDGSAFLITEGNTIYTGSADIANVMTYSSKAPVLSAAFISDGHRIIMTDEAGTVSILDALTGVLVARFNTGVESLTRADLSIDGHLLAAAADRRIMLWRMPGNLLLRSVEVANDIASLAFSTNGTKLLIRFQNGTSYSVNVETGRAADFFAGPS
jgi:hypothetical protein